LQIIYIFFFVVEDFNRFYFCMEGNWIMIIYLFARKRGLCGSHVFYVEKKKKTCR